MKIKIVKVNKTYLKNLFKFQDGMWAPPHTYMLFT